MKKILALAAAALLTIPALADEGMWLLPLLQKMNGKALQEAGCKLTPEQIYSINNTSLKDAIIHFGGGCTGEIISGEGLIVTNHHCGYSSIQSLSTPEHNYLMDGYWAMSREGELPCRGLTVTFLKSMTDVTDILAKVEAKAAKGGDEKAVEEALRAKAQELTAEAEKANPNCTAQISSFYNGNVQYLIVSKVYRDIRFVGAPPASVGKFGGETDNWMWPRHTGDFSIFRIYAGKDNMPADYSEDNVPYRPKKSLKISLAGVKEGDFTFVYGCPGSTREYVHSAEVDYVANVSDPQKIALRTTRLDIMKKYMSQSQAVRIQYSSKFAGVANAWKKWQGEEKGIRKMNTVAEKREFEKGFEAWAKGKPCEGITDTLASLYARRNPVFRAYEYYNETVRAIEKLQMASGRPVSAKDYYRPIDEETFTAMMTAFDKGLDDCYKPEYFLKSRERFASMEEWKDAVFADSLEAKNLAEALNTHYSKVIAPQVNSLGRRINLANRTYMKAQMEYCKDKTFYPDANLTLRVAYGHVRGYSPADGVSYNPVSTLTGIIEKDDPDIFDYNIPQTLRDIYARGGYEAQPVCFLATNHTSGGNSGSPVLNADGNLIGINFDRVWEGTMSDYVFDPDFCRNISIDVRYILFTIKEIGHADYLLDEMSFVK